VTPFRVVGSTTRVESGFLRLDEVEVEGPDGDRFSRSVVRHPGAVMIVPVDNDREHVFLVRQYRASIDGDVLEVPAGKRDVDGEEPEATACRELEEEIGRHPDRLVKLCEAFMSPGFTDEYAHMYCGLDLRTVETGEPASHEEGAMTVERIRLHDIERLIATRELIDAKSIVSLLLTKLYLSGDYPGMET
jgi:ADP-ribose pyrophosphatase